MKCQLWWQLALTLGATGADLDTRGSFLKPWQPNRHRVASTPERRQITPLPSAAADRQLPAVEQPPAPVTAAPIPTYTRPLGSWERLLTKTQRNERDAPLSIAHFSVAELTGTSSLTRDDVRRALEGVVLRHPLLRVQIGDLPVGDECCPRPQSVEWPWFYPLDASADELVDRAVVWVDVEARNSAELRNEWRTLVEGTIDGVTFPRDAPLWLLHVVHSPSAGRSALVWLFNHAISDQISAHIVLEDLLDDIQPHSSKHHADNPAPLSVSFPPSVEALLFGNTSIEEPFVDYVRRVFSWQTVKHLVRATATIVCPVMLVLDRRRGEGLTPSQRHTQLCLRTLGRPLMEKLKHRSRREGTTVTAALIAAALMACQDVSGMSNPLVRFLLSTDLRRFAVNSPLPRPCTLSSLGGSVEFNLRVPPALAGSHEAFWRFAKGCREEFRSVIDVSGREGPLLFDVGMRVAEIEDVVEKAAASEQTHGRAYTCGLSNAGVWPGRTQYGPISLDGVYYGVTNSQNGCLFQLSCVTVGGRLCVCLQTSAPLIERGEAERFLDVMDRELCRAVDTV
ncbi:unnamed protein product [Vitrella brassicaformis CCMP3155]|uniref:Diacylglycerol O-acyltransferase n=2 Tax=Vitrella brassicaformis TaxID=1169539 RepID=A0A0G4EFM9_VITBC|nr:unnamed protein product [Vitrella brassicaformis CCMP3155]|eukprot:CEL94306.1 unnamed protein product [Vitrella brassicaformis CCMP3155]